MLIPSNVLKLGKYVEKNDGLYSGSEKAIGLRRIGENLQAVASIHGHFVVSVTWPELPMEDFPMLNVTPQVSREKAPRAISLPGSVCEKALKSIDKKSAYPVLKCLLLEEVPTIKGKDGLRCFTNDLVSTSEYKYEPEDIDSIFKWVDEAGEMFTSEEKQATVNGEYLSTINSMFKEVLESKKVIIKIETGHHKDTPIRLSASDGNIKAVCYLMPCLV